MDIKRLRMFRRKSGAPAHFIPSFIVFIMMMILIGFSWQTAIRNVEQNKVDQVKVRSAFLESTLTQRIIGYENLLKAGNGLFSASTQVDRDEWKDFADEMQLDERFPAAMALAYAELIPAAQKDKFITDVRRDGFPNFKIEPEKPVRLLYSSVAFIEPFNDRNKIVFGDDLLTESTRRTFMEKARDTNATVMSDVVPVRQDDNTFKNGVYLFHPVYRQGAAIDTLPQRRQAIQGYIYTPLRLDKLFESLSSNEDDNNSFNFVAHDGDRLTDETLLFEKRSVMDAQEFATIDRNVVSFVGQEWQIEYSVNDDIVPTSIRDRPNSIILGGTIFSLIVAVIVLLLLQRRTRMIASAEDKRLQRAKDDMLSLASHQLRTPATGVKQYLGMVLEGFTGKISLEQQEILKRAYDSNERQLRIINEFLYLAKAEAERIVISPQKLDLVEFTKQIVDDMRTEIEEAGHIIRLKHPSTLQCFADKHSARMIIENLISNAIKYTPTDGEITVAVRSKGAFGMVAVTDTGVGIAKKHFGKLFKQFSRIPNELSKYTSGSGIGLYLSQILAQQNNGYIDVVSEIGHGSTFTAYFPRKSVKNITVKRRPKQ